MTTRVEAAAPRGGSQSANVGRAAERLTAWFALHRRDLPWRKPRTGNPDGPSSLLAEAVPAFAGLEAPSLGSGRDPYAVWISEIMLQQTQVATVIDYFRRWMERFPDVETLAQAGEEEVLSQWSGLGYYSRARNLLVTARLIASEHGGVFPRSRRGLLALKGIGEYTAGAICSLAFNLPEPILDGNLVRVFSRFYGLDFLPDTASGKEAYWSAARDWTRAGPPALVNEGLMELGALVCVPRNPACADCPLAEDCVARREARTQALPPPKARSQGREIRGIALVTSCGNDVLLYRPSKGELLAGLLTFPVFAADTLPALRKAWREGLPGMPLPALRPRPATVAHSITHHNFRLKLVEGRLEPGPATAAPPAGYAWVPAAQVDKALVSSFPKKIWKAFG